MKLKFADIRSELQNVDNADVLGRMDSSPALRTALEMSRPQNWWGIGIQAEHLINISRNEGIPLAWIPRREVIASLAQARDGSDRSNVLLGNEQTILHDCSEALAACTDPWLKNTAPLALRALAAYRAGFHEASMALAVSIGEPLSSWASEPRVRPFSSEQQQDNWEKEIRKHSHYKRAKLELEELDLDPFRQDIIWKALAAPVPKFFEPWWSGKGQPQPADLSRHVVAHQPMVQHFTRRNALISQMLISSILRAQQQWSEDVRASDAPGE